MTDYVLVGGGGLAREIHDWFVPGFAATGDRFVGFLADGDGQERTACRELPHLGPIEGHRPDASQRLVMAIGSPVGKEVAARRLLAAGGVFASLLHPSAWISGSARIGMGVVVAVFADVSADAVLGDFTMLNGYASAGHDAVVGDFSTLSGYVDLTGGVSTGRGCFFGSGSRVLPGLVLGHGCTVGAGAVVMRSVPDGATAYAAPARLL
ncbi:LbetaH domain-containing protein [Muricoccus vinaceus]|uniref:Acetyltransferase n=1 Tax=Muricoccus vinaceus TaxID=424704 RepID=A0ABV6IU60_9PROT